MSMVSTSGNFGIILFWPFWQWRKSLVVFHFRWWKVNIIETRIPISIVLYFQPSWMELCFLIWNWIHFERDLDEYDMEMIPETKLENFDLTDFEIHSVILKRNNSNIFCLHSKNKDLVEEQREDFSCTAWFARCATRLVVVNLKKYTKN